MVQPVLMTPNVDSGEQGQSKVRSAMQVSRQTTESSELAEDTARLRYWVNMWLCTGSDLSATCASVLCLPLVTMHSVNCTNVYPDFAADVFNLSCTALPAASKVDRQLAACPASMVNLDTTLAGFRERNQERGAAPFAQFAQHHGR